ncbi:ABC transporter ATP-binding protein [Cytobacillus firmus]|uniref:ABC transporter ATP-binding protein n=1 Tax=Cytobacillus firmus TaxID=1399 RepID=UPI0024C1852A|nr:ABC transporter ATP-binding protein [Cytobacillus firmus]WHY59853.1 ABC transporter ATP-binding protein [Cytobacillus firmus]
MNKGILNPLNKYKGMFSATILITLGIVLLQAYFPYINKIIVDDIVTNKNYALINSVIISIIIVALFMCILDVIKRWLITTIAENIQKNLKEELLSHLRKKPFEYQVKKSDGYLVSYFQSDITLITLIYRDIFPITIQIFFQIAISLTIIISVNVKILLMGILIICLNVIITKSFSHKIKDLSTRNQHENAKVHSFLTDTLKGSKEILNSNAEEWEKSKNRKVLKKPISTSLALTKISALSLNINLFIYWLSFAMITYFGLGLVRKGEMSIGILIATTTYFMSLLSPVLLLFEMNIEYKKALGGWKRVRELISQEDRPEKNKTINVSLKEISSCNVLDVSYAHPGLTKKLLNNINFSAARGEITLIKGVSGEGKSTLVQLVAGFLSPSGGKIFLDDLLIDEIPDTELRKHMKVMFQDPDFFVGTIADNLTFNKENITEEEIHHVLSCLNCEFIYQYSDGIHSILDEKIRLSGGQKKRLALARTILSKSQVLILDEPTSGLDLENEQIILNYLSKIKDQRIIIIISHSSLAEKYADRKYELNHGKLEFQTLGGDSLAGSN